MALNFLCSKAINAYRYTFIQLLLSHFKFVNLLVNNFQKINILFKTNFFLLQFGTNFLVDRVEISILYGQWHDISHLSFIMSTFFAKMARLFAFSICFGEFGTKFNTSEGQ